MGAVYRGRQKSLNRLVAIKILPPEVEDGDASYLERFKNEAQVMAKFIHPGIVAIHDFGETAEGQLYIVMEYVDGSDVSRMIATQGRLPPEHALAIAAHVCDALGYAHSHGVIHRDIKPANILINREGAVKVADFGLAKIDEPGTTGLTKTGMAMGTPDYIAPEALVFGSQVDARADLYAVGVMLYHMLTGEVPRGAFDLPSHRIGTDPRFDAIILKAMKMDREERYQSSGAIRHDLDAILTLPLVQAGGESSAAIPQSSTNFQVREEAPATRAASQNHPSKIVNHKAAMITLATTAAVLATGAFLVLKQPQADAENAPQSQNSAQESQATSAAKQSGPLNRSEAEIASQRLPEGRAGRGNPLSGPSNDAKTTAQGTERTTPPAAPPAKPVLVAQANTTPKALQLGQSAPSADPVPARKPDPAKWVKLDPKADCVAGKDLALSSGDWGWKVTDNKRFKTKQTYANSAIRAFIRQESGEVSKLMLRADDTLGAYHLNVTDKDVSILLYVKGVSPMRELKCFKIPPSVSFKDSGAHLTFSAAGSVLTVWAGGLELGSVSDNTYQSGSMAFGSTDGAFRDIEYQTLDASTPAIAQTPAETPIPATPPSAAPQTPLPPELTALQQQYDKLLVERVTGLYDADVAKLNAGYLAGLDRAAATAQSAGELDTVLALTAEKKRLEAKQPVSATDDAGTPAALKNLRTIYRTSLAKLDEQRTANHTALLTPYATRLQQIEADLTKAGRIADAVAVKTYREGLGTNPAPTAPVTPAASTPMKETPAATPAANGKQPKTDPRTAAEWVLGLGEKVILFDGKRRTISKVEELPAGKLGNWGIVLDGKDGNLKVISDADMNRFAGQDELKEVVFRKVPLTEAGMRFIKTCLNLTEVVFEDMRLNEDWLAHLKGLKKLTSLEIVGKVGYRGLGLEQLAGLPIENLRVYRSNFNDQGLAAIKGFKSIVAMNLEDTEVTDAGLANLADFKKLKVLNAGVTQITAQGLEHLKYIGITEIGFGKTTEDFTADLPKVAKLFPDVTSFTLPRNLSYTAQEIALLGRSFPKLNNILTYSLGFSDDACAGLVEAPAMRNLSIISAGKITDAGLAPIARLKSLQSLTLHGCQMTDRGLELFMETKSLKNLFIHGVPITDAGLAAFKKARPDVMVEK